MKMTTDIEAITYLLAMRQPINFPRVVNQSGINRSSLYSIPGIKEKFAYYREQGISCKKQDVIWKNI